jgi:ABC-type uncharacterized transport system permease subunit
LIALHQIAAALYLAAGIGALLGVALPSRRMARGATWGIGLGAMVHAAGFATLHRIEPTPSLTDILLAISLMAWMAVLIVLYLSWRFRLPGFVAAVGPVAFLAAFGGALRLSTGMPSATLEAALGGGSMPHAHVLLASAGFAFLGIANVAGLFFLVEHRRLKTKHPLAFGLRLPSLEILDRVNVVSLSLGFPLLSLGVLTGMLWLQTTSGELWLGSTHETWSAIAWAIYAGLALARFAGRQGARQAAASAVAGFAFLLFAIVGVGVFE